jgi:hypothetical protein
MKIKLLTFIFIMVLSVVFAFQFTAIAATDAPHNASNNINCGSCHGAGLLNSPFWGGSMSYDQLCLNCHKASSGPYSETNAPLVVTHSSETTSDKYGDWERECRNCHNPHYQRQKLYKNTDANNLYLATGTITNCVYNGDNTSTLTYSTITYKTGWDAARLTEKTAGYRRTILFPNVNKLGYNYPITAVDPDAKTIKVTGNVTTILYPPTTFAAIYGQFIKDAIDVNGTNKQVKFFDRKGTKSYADGDTTYNGVCEVCHTQTMYHKNDGTGNYHYPGARCYVCHAHINGFGYAHGESGSDCDDCHGHDDGWNGGDYYGTTQSHSTHTENDSDDLKGPNITCSDCHDTDDYPFFKSGTDGDADGKYNLSETDVCDNCHSPNGAFDGVDNPTFGAKANWTDGVYASPTLKAGKEKWCVGCHDDFPALNKPQPIEEPIVVDNPQGTFTGSWPVSGSLPGFYGSNYQFHVLGSGTDYFRWTPTISTPGIYEVFARWTANSTRAPDATYTVYHDGGSTSVTRNQRSQGGQWVSLGTFSMDGIGDYVQLAQSPNGEVCADAIRWSGGAISAPNVVGNNTDYGFYLSGHNMNCLNCHDAAKNHIDGEERTYEVDESQVPPVVVNAYTPSYRLKEIDGLPALNVPNAGGNPVNRWQDFALCFSCHNRFELLNAIPTNLNLPHTNFWDNRTTRGNAHTFHLNFTSLHFDSDWDSVVDSGESCITCHNVHGSPSHVMIRHGELISTSGTTDKVPALDFVYLKGGGFTATATWPAPAGTYYVYGRWTSASTRATNAEYIINYNGGSSVVVTKDQTSQGGQWVPLGIGTQTFVTGDSVVLSIDGVNGEVCADAIGWDSDGVLGPDPEIIVDNTSAAFTRDGVSTDWTHSSTLPGYWGTDYQFHTKPGDTPVPDDGTVLVDSVGGQMRHRGNNVSITYVCDTCHTPDKTAYVRDPYLGPRVFAPKAEPDRVDSGVESQVVLTVYIYDPDNNISSVTIDLSSIGGSATQPMYNDGTYGDLTAGDNIYSFVATVPDNADKGLNLLTITATDDDLLINEAVVELMVANEGWLIMDNYDADHVGYWGTSAWAPGYYGTDYFFHATGLGTNTATFSPELPQGGNYNIYARWTASADRATNTPYIIKHNGISDTVRFDQQANGGKFVYLGTYYFTAQSEHIKSIVDNLEADFVGGWGSSSSVTVPYGSNYYFHSAGTGTNYVTFTPGLPLSGNYDVYAWWTREDARATNAPYTVNYSGGADTVRIDQTQGGGKWTYLGTYYFDAQEGHTRVIVDNLDADFTGSWTASTSVAGYYGSNYHLHDAGTGTDTATFAPDLPVAGNYDVYAWWSASAVRASNAPYTINYNGGSDTVNVDQRVNGGQFVYLGTYYFEAGSSGTVVLSDNADASVCADAVKFQLSAVKQGVVVSDDADSTVCADAVKWQLSEEKQGITLSDDGDGTIISDAILFEPAD